MYNFALRCVHYFENLQIQMDDRKAKEMGISAFVMKPIVMLEMANTIRQVLDEK